MDNLDLRKHLAEGRLLKEELTPLQQYVYNFEKEVSGEDNAKEFLDGIKKLNTPKDVYDYYAFERNWEGDSDLEGDLENIYNQVLDKFKSKNENKTDNFDLKKYLAEGKLLKQSKLSSSEYQKAKKLKGFDPKNYEWDKNQNLYLMKESNTLKEGHGLSQHDLDYLEGLADRTDNEKLKKIVKVLAKTNIQNK